VPTSASLAAEIDKKIRENPEARFRHRLHVLRLVLNGWTCEEAGGAFGDSARSVRRWLQAYNTRGDEGLQEKRAGGRPARLTEEHLDAIRTVMKKNPSPRTVGLESDNWTGKALAEWLRREYLITITDRRARQILASERPKILAT